MKSQSAQTHSGCCWWRCRSKVKLVSKFRSSFCLKPFDISASHCESYIFAFEKWNEHRHIAVQTTSTQIDSWQFVCLVISLLKRDCVNCVNWQLKSGFERPNRIFIRILQNRFDLVANMYHVVRRCRCVTTDDSWYPQKNVQSHRKLFIVESFGKRQWRRWIFKRWQCQVENCRRGKGSLKNQFWMMRTSTDSNWLQ